uniref:NADH dehydrogenase subunit 2 n=1 Tax=Nephropsis grandis TaxID=2801450 RepID=UPI0024358B51|nr:NADH dehydrogenase subunit 2 [Nephropsis grandis]WEU77729.1 NADH dehydrogenase subunit 2 [Nephropsis grandis]
MLFSSSRVMFTISLMAGVILAVSATTWFGAWVGLELNLLSFIPLIVTKNNRYASEAALKYFLIQVLGSALIIFSASIMMFYQKGSPLFITLALLLKLGAAPFHSWFPQVMEGMNWMQSIILMTIQKITPLFLISYLINDMFVISIIFYTAALSAIVGSVSGINQTSLRKIMAFSSINHMAWMLSAIMMSDTVWIMYFSFYSVMSSTVVILFNSQHIYYFSQITINNNLQFSSKIFTFMSLFSLGGLPPFSGFIPKWLMIQEMIAANLFSLLLILLSSTLISLYYYIRITVSSLMLAAPKMKSNTLGQTTSKLSPVASFLNLFGLFIPSVFIMF